jgi:hypothetical protein
VFTDYKQAGPCDGVDHYRQLAFTCCSPVAPPPPVSCESRIEGGPTSCKDVATWKLYASQTCEAAGLLLNDYTPTEDCGSGNYRYVRYTCCKPAPSQPPPPPAACERRQEGSPTSCKDVGTWKEYASGICGAAGLLLQEYEPAEDCDNGNYRYVRFTCCRSQPPSPPPVSVCETFLQGNPTSCEEPSTWKDSAFSACRSVGLELTDYLPTEDCGNGKTRYVRYTCCR